MSIAVDALNVIVPVERLDRAWPGGLNALLKSHPEALDWHDGTVARNGARDPGEVEAILRFYEGLGLTARSGDGRQEAWQDLCVLDASRTDQPACPWLSYDPERHCVSLKGREGSPILGPGTFCGCFGKR
jgi:hypothetical protein